MEFAILCSSSTINIFIYNLYLTHYTSKLKINLRMTKYKEFFEKMLLENKADFDKFRAIHADYGMDEESHQDEFNKVGAEILKIVNEWENKLCAHSEKAGYA